MPIAKISQEGLAAMALCVALLWACLGMEWYSVRRANHDNRQALRQMQLLQASHMKRYSDTQHYRSWSVNGSVNHNRL